MYSALVEFMKWLLCSALVLWFDEMIGVFIISFDYEIDVVLSINLIQLHNGCCIQY